MCGSSTYNLYNVYKISPPKSVNDADVVVDDDDDDDNGINVTHVIIGVGGGALLLVIGGVVTFFILRKVKCCNRQQAPEDGQELKPKSETEKPIPVQDFRRSGSHWMPKEEEFEELNRVDLKKNALSKSKEDGRYFVREHIPLNR